MFSSTMLELLSFNTVCAFLGGILNRGKPLRKHCEYGLFSGLVNGILVRGLGFRYNVCFSVLV